MRHPFDGINRPTRRTWLGLMAAVGAYLGFGPAAEAASPLTGRRAAPPKPKPKPATTLALNEEGGKVTTKAGKEEAATTFALGEEGGGPPATTLAIGEEGAKKT